MNVFIPDPSKNEGSSLILAILVGVAAIVVIALMIQTTKEDGKKGRYEVQQDAIGETLDVFNKFDSVMEGSNGESKDEKVQEGVESPPQKRGSRPNAPMDLTRPPSKVNQGEGEKPQASSFFDGFGTNGKEGILATEVDSSYGALDVITGFNNIPDTAEAALNETTMPIIAAGDRGPAPLNAERVVPSPLMPEAMLPLPKLPELDPRASSGVERAVPRLVELTPDSELDVALREAVAVKEGFSAAAEVSPVNRLSAPLFSHPAGSFPLKHFDIELKLANPNPKRLSQIRYSIGEGEWLVYEGTPINVRPGTKVKAYCESMDRAWGDSLRESRDFLEQTVSLTPPTIYASALEFDEGTNQRISIAITNPNRYAASRVEYRFGGSPWQVYREMVKIDGAPYSDSGVRVEARVVGVIGVAGRQASESVAVELAPAGGRSESVAVEAAPERESIIEFGYVDLGAPAGPHGYRAQNSAQIELTRMSDPDVADRFLLETFEAYRKVHEDPENRHFEPLAGDGHWGRLSILMPDEGDSIARSVLAERKPEKGVLEGSAISLFESAVVQ